MKARFPIGLVFQRKRFHKAKELTVYIIKDIYKTFNNAGECVKLEYLVTHEFFGQEIGEMMVDTTIARSLTNEQLAEYCK